MQFCITFGTGAGIGSLVLRSKRLLLHELPLAPRARYSVTNNERRSFTFAYPGTNPHPSLLLPRAIDNKGARSC